jgi:hypothetical protein
MALIRMLHGVEEELARTHASFLEVRQPPGYYTHKRSHPEV